MNLQYGSHNIYLKGLLWNLNELMYAEVTRFTFITRWAVSMHFISFHLNRVPKAHGIHEREFAGETTLTIPTSSRHWWAFWLMVLKLS